MSSQTKLRQESLDQQQDRVDFNGIPEGEYVSHRQDLIRAYRQVRTYTLDLAAPLSPEDMQLQSMADASPTKWHLAHTTWFFSTLLLSRLLPDFRAGGEHFEYLYNSYYNGVGAQYPRARRGMVSRPSVAEIHDYRQQVDTAMIDQLAACDEACFEGIAPLLVLGLNHEQQHQELLLMDIKHALFQNPAYPAYAPDRQLQPAAIDSASLPPLEFTEVPGGLVEVGHQGAGFAYDNEKPRHQVFLAPYAMGRRLVSNGEFLDFINDGGYRQSLLWLSDGWAWRQQSATESPLYWLQRDGEWWHYTLSGLRRIDLAEPVCHLSFYEADAFATWRDARLPTEAEWEHYHEHITPVDTSSSHYNRWEWTRSAYQPYPGFRPFEGEAAEYNGKFMSNQMVLRGVCGATPACHSRVSYRNFFYPHQRWQFSGLRLAMDSPPSDTST